MSSFRIPRELVHDLIGEWECEYGYDIKAKDRHDLAERLIAGFYEEYGRTRIYDAHYALLPNPDDRGI
jgi:hypothetical protein